MTSTHPRGQCSCRMQWAALGSSSSGRRPAAALRGGGLSEWPAPPGHSGSSSLGRQSSSGLMLWRAHPHSRSAGTAPRVHCGQLTSSASRACLAAGTKRLRQLEELTPPCQDARAPLLAVMTGRAQQVSASPSRTSSLACRQRAGISTAFQFHSKRLHLSGAASSGAIQDCKRPRGVFRDSPTLVQTRLKQQIHQSSNHAFMLPNRLPSFQPSRTCPLLHPFPTCNPVTYRAGRSLLQFGLSRPASPGRSTTLRAPGLTATRPGSLRSVLQLEHIPPGHTTAP
jgi:hypothetical protein